MRLAIAILFLLGTGCGASPEETQGFRGGTMGTSYQVTYSGTDAQVEEDQAAVEDLLAQVNQSLSTYIESSLISEINSSTDTTLWHTIDLHFERVFDRSKTLHQQTNGAFNPAVGPLVGAWGFGPEGINRVPSSRTIDSLLMLIDFDDFIKHPTEQSIRKRVAGASLDFNAIAKGYGVDVVADFFRDRGTPNYFVEIGGEVRTGGQHPSGRPWRVGIEKPAENQLAGQETQQVVELSDRSMATSGNYRNFYVEEGRKYVHTVDPITGYTRTSSLLSASVLAPDCMTADAYATALMVMGVDQALALVETRADLEAYFIVSDDKGEYAELRSSQFPASGSK